MDAVDNYNNLRKRIISLYTQITKYTYLVNLARSSFYTLEQLERLERINPIGGISRYNTITEMPITIEKMLLAYRNVGDELHLGFVKPKRDIPIVYECIQQYIKAWTEVKLSLYGFSSVPMAELYELENLARSLFSTYRYYELETRYTDLSKASKSLENGMANLYLSIIQYGNHAEEEISFVSYLDLYEQALGEGGFQTPNEIIPQNTPVLSNNFVLELPNLHVGLS